MKTSQITELVNLVLNGEINPLSAYAVVNTLEKELKKAKQQIESCAFDEAEKHGSKSFKFENADFSIRTGYAILDYEKDHVYCELTEKLKARKELLDMVHNTKQTVYGDDGFEVPNVGVKTYTKDSLIVKIK